MRFRRKQIVSNSQYDTTTNIDISQSKPIGVTIPFNNPNGVFYQSYTHRQQVYSNLKNLLMTAKGERYMQPEFGTAIRLVLFENISSEDEFTDRLTGEITDAITSWLPYLSIDSLQVKLNMSDDGRVDDSSHAVSISLSVRVSGTNIYLPIQIFISDTGELTIEEAVYNE